MSVVLSPKGKARARVATGTNLPFQPQLAMRKHQLLLPLLSVVGLSASNAAAQAQALVAHWSFEETAGATLGDDSGNSHHASIQGGVTLGVQGAHVNTGLAARFDAATQGLATILDQPPLSGLSNDLTLAAWVYSASSPTAPRRVFGGNLSAWSCGIRPGGLRFTTTGIKDYDLNTSVPVGQWFHLAFVFDAQNSVTFYVNGASVGTVTGNSPANPSNGQWLIGSWNTLVEFWDGDLDDVQIYSGSLTGPDIAFLHANPGSTVAPGGGTTYCFGDAPGVCPCGNLGQTGEGCGNSTGAGGRLAATGTVSVTADDLLLSASQLVPGRAAVLFAAHQALGGGSGISFGDGLRCAGGSAVRLGMRVVDGSGTASWGPGLGATGAWQAGDTRRMQVWYQDAPSASPCGTGFNLTHALELTFTL